MFLALYLAISGLIAPSEAFDEARFHECFTYNRANISKIRSLEYHGDIEGWAINSNRRSSRHTRSFKATNGCRFLEVKHESSGSFAEWDRNHTTGLMRAGQFSIYNHFNRTLEVTQQYGSVAANPKLEQYVLDFYCVSIAWLPEEDKYSPLLEENSWPFILQSKPAKHEFIGEREFSDVTCTGHKITTDGCVAEYWFSKDSHRLPTRIVKAFDGTPKFRVEFVYGDYRPVSGITFQLPYRVQRRIFRNSEITPAAYTRLTIHELSVNTLDTKDFNIAVEPGCLTSYFDSKDYEFEPGGFEMLDTIIAYAQKQIEVNQKRNKRISSFRLFLPVLAVLFVVALACAALLNIAGLRRK